MILLLAAAALSAGAPTAIDAERAFARDAQRIGQWAAFRKYAAHDAVMFTPQAIWARDFLKGRKDLTKAATWTPAASIMSCDRSVAVNGGAYQTSTTRGRFTTVWMKDKSAWKWIYDSAEPTAEALPTTAAPMISRAACTGRPTGAPIATPPALSPPSTGKPNDYGRGESSDRTLGWDWKVEKDGTRTFRVYQWTGHGYAQRIFQRVAPKL